MGTNSAPFLTDLFLYSYDAEFIPKDVRGPHWHYLCSLW
jgi:hypothetical protein